MTKPNDGNHFFVDSGNTETPMKRHTNPDGSMGGWIAVNATVPSSTIMDPCSIVGAHAVVKENTEIFYGEGIFA